MDEPTNEPKVETPPYLNCRIKERKDSLELQDDRLSLYESLLATVRDQSVIISKLAAQVQNLSSLANWMMSEDRKNLRKLFCIGCGKLGNEEETFEHIKTCPTHPFRSSQEQAKPL